MIKSLGETFQNVAGISGERDSRRRPRQVDPRRRRRAAGASRLPSYPPPALQEREFEQFQKLAYEKLAD